MADTGFAGERRLVVLYKRYQSTDWILRGLHNRLIRKQRIVNKWVIVYINNRHRLFLGRWLFANDLLPMAYETAAILCNWIFFKRGYAPEPRNRYDDKLAQYECDSSEGVPL